MNLTEFLAQPEIAALTLAEQVVAANEYSVTETVKIEGATRKTAVETVNLMYNTVDRLKAYTPPPELESQYHDAATDIAKKVVKAFENLYKPEFYINVADSEVSALFTWALNFGVLTATEHSRIVQAATKITFPFKGTTEETITGSTVDAHTVKYGETELDYVIKLANQDLQIFAVFDEAPPEDCTVDVFVWEQPIEAVPHAKTAKTNIIRIKSGDISTGTTLTKNLKRKIKFSATCNKAFPFTLYVNW